MNREELELVREAVIGLIGEVQDWHHDLHDPKRCELRVDGGRRAIELIERDLLAE